MSGSGKSSLAFGTLYAEAQRRYLESVSPYARTVIAVDHDMRVIAASDHISDIGPGAGDNGGRMVAQGTPQEVARAADSRTAPHIARFLADTRDEPAA